MAISMEVRRKVVAALGRGESGASIARRFKVSTKTVGRLKRRHASGADLGPGKTGPKGPTKLTPEDDRVMREAVANRPGVTAMELIPMLSVEVAECTVCRRLKRLGLSLKKSR